MKQNDLPAKLRRSKQNREQYQKRKRSVMTMKEWSDERYRKGTWIDAKTKLHYVWKSGQWVNAKTGEPKP